MGTWNQRAAIGFTSLWLLLAAACSDSSSKADSKVPDGGTEDWGPVSPLACGSDCHDFVISKITLPGTTSQLGWDFNHDGTKDNALGQILGIVSTMASTMNLQKNADDGINSGETLLLLRLQAASLADATSAKAQAWIGAATKCCSDPTQAGACATQAKQSCFAGNHAFYPSAGSPQDARLAGKITASALALGPGLLTYVLPLGTVGTLTMNLRAVHVTGTVSADGKTITNGVLAGVLMKSDIDTTLMDQTAKLIDSNLKDPTTDQTMKDTIAGLFDTNKDGTVTAAEVKASSLAQSLMSGDVDVVKADGTPGQDGVNEMSLGLGFEAVSAVIRDGQQPPADGGVGDQGTHADGHAADQGTHADGHAADQGTHADAAHPG